ncbi:uncharacterized protein LOC135805136 [Sycon ciliatum]|uniref:uncharacterized protein LOC135805136 n=1 Tax=Sycon ciliatum TaxID=27933 RepID=UPI0020ADC5A1|eukprot:scpid80582/ scgid15599/ mRNA cap guanine-N7 methyltransferase; RG7MT1; mRNA (guanine-N(7)-)-methyltransferase; mRNA cap methyltransferase
MATSMHYGPANGDRRFTACPLPPGRTHTAFLVHASADTTWVVGKLVPQLEERGLRVFLMHRDRDPSWSDDRNLDHALMCSSVVVPIITPYFLSSRTCSIVSHHARQKHAQGRVCLATVKLAKCDTPEPLRGLPKLNLFEDKVRPFFFDLLYQMIKDGCEHLSGRTCRDYDDSPNAKRPYLVSPPSIDSNASQHSSPYELSSPIGGIQGFQSNEDSPLEGGVEQQSPDAQQAQAQQDVQCMPAEADPTASAAARGFTSPVVDPGFVVCKLSSASADSHISHAESSCLPDTPTSPRTHADDQPVHLCGEQLCGAGSSPLSSPQHQQASTSPSGRQRRPSESVGETSEVRELCDDAPFDRLSPRPAGNYSDGDSSPTPWLDDTDDDENANPKRDYGLPDFRYGSPTYDEYHGFSASPPTHQQEQRPSDNSNQRSSHGDCGATDGGNGAAGRSNGLRFTPPTDRPHPVRKERSLSRHSSGEIDDEEEEGEYRDDSQASQATQPENTAGNAATIKNFYNQLPEAGKGARYSSPIFHMRNINNWIKSILIKKSVSLVPGSSKGMHVLDLCCGKGGDLLKWKEGRVGHLVGADIADHSIQQCRQRAGEHKLPFKTEFHTVDCTRDNLQHLFQGGEGFGFNITSCQFSLHYGFESEQQALQILANACQNLKPGGVFIGTIPDANHIVHRLRQGNGKSFGNSVYKVSFDDQMLSMEQFPLFGAKYHFHLEGVVDVPEYLIYFPLLCQILAERHNMKLVWKKHFHEFFNEEKEVPENLRLLNKMKCLATEQANDHGMDGGGKVGTISQDEWEAIGLYLVFCFQKR